MIVQFVFELAAHAFAKCLAPALARAGVGEDAQVAVRRFSGREWIVGKAVTKVRHRKGASLGQRLRRGQRVGQAGKQRGHLGGRLEIALVVDPQGAPGRVQRGLHPDAA